MDRKNNEETKPKEYCTPKLITYGNLLEITGFAVKKEGIFDGARGRPMGKSPVT